MANCFRLCYPYYFIAHYMLIYMHFKYALYIYASLYAHLYASYICTLYAHYICTLYMHFIYAHLYAHIVSACAIPIIKLLTNHFPWTA